MILRTVRIRVPRDERLVETIRLFSKIYQFMCDVGFENKTYSKVKLHKLTYKKLRKMHPNFPSALLQTARDLASESLKQTKLRKEIHCKDYSSIRLDKRNLKVSLKFNQISISSISGRIKFNFANNPLILKYKSWQPVSGRLSYRKGQLFLNVVVKKESPDAQPFSLDELLGIDRGVNNIAVCSNNEFFNSKLLRKIKGRYQYLRKVLQSKGTRSAKRKLKKISGRERRFVSDVNHCLSKTIAKSKYKVFVLEKLNARGHRKLGKVFNKKLGGWSFRQLENFLTYKSEELGKRVLYVDPRYTSQRCSKCGYTSKSNRSGSRFRCRACKFQLHADLNASRNIANLGKSEISRLSFSQPNVAFSYENSYKPMSLGS